MSNGFGTKARAEVWIGRVLTALVVLFLVLDAAIKLVPIAPVVETLTLLGYPVEVARGLGILALVCTLLYVFPRTSLVGAILLTGYLGGAIASQLRIGAPVFSHLLFGVYLGAFIWGGLILRNERVKALLWDSRGVRQVRDDRLG